MSKKADTKILRVDPDRRAIAPMTIRTGRDARRELARVCRAKNVGFRELMAIQEKRAMGPSSDPHVKTLVDRGAIVLTVIAGADVDESARGWRLRGGDDTAGISILIGRVPGTGEITDCPVNAAWLSSRILWVEPEDIETVRARAEATLPAMDAPARWAVMAALPTPDGAMWIPEDHNDALPAVLAHGAGTPSTGGRKLSPLGEAIYDMLGEKG